MPGPPPSNSSVRRNNPKKDFRVLPAGARAIDKVPDWPLGPDVKTLAALEASRDRVANLQVELEDCEDGRKRGRIQRELHRLELSVAQLEIQVDQARDMEVSLWEDLWHMPQGSLWEESHAQREVAQYVRWKVRAEQGDLDAAKEARQLSDRLGLTPLALLRLRAEVERADEAEARGAARRRGRSKDQDQDQGDDKGASGGGRGKGKGDDDPRAGLYSVS